MAIQRLDTLPANGAGRTSDVGNELSFATKERGFRGARKIYFRSDSHDGLVGTKTHESEIHTKTCVDSFLRDVST